MAIRDSVVVISPPWLQGENASTFTRAFCTVLDALNARLVEGIKLRMPGVCSPTALGYIGADRNIERGPTQSDDGYAAQLSAAFDTWRTAGSARTVLSQIHLYFAPSAGPVLRSIAIRNDNTKPSTVWHELDPVTGAVTKTVTGQNWLWRPFGQNKWWWGFIIIDVTGIVTLKHWGDGGTYGDGLVWGAQTQIGFVNDLKGIVRKWKPANVYAFVILTFDHTTFERTDTAPPNPNGNGEDPVFRLTVPANFWEPIGT